MSILDIFYIIVLCVILLYIITKCIVGIIRKVKGLDDVAWESMCRMCAELIEAGVEIPKDILVKLLRKQLSTHKFYESIKTLKVKK